ncbi:MAG: RluA family pseudouridine synthase [Balneolaceae bacterium]
MQTTDIHPNIQILYEDENLLVVNKPSNLLSQKDATGDPDLLTLCKSYLQKKNPEKTGNPYLGLLHRLDRPVSGLMILAKTKNSAAVLSEQIRKRKIRKVYHAVVHGEVPPNGNWVHPLKKDPQRNYVVVTTPDNKQAKVAELSFIRVSYSQQENLSFVKINLLTGRPHQIRVQFAAEGYPVFGDSKYGSHVNHQNKLALHSSQVMFYHPVNQKSMKLSIPPEETHPWSLFN